MTDAPELTAISNDAGGSLDLQGFALLETLLWTREGSFFLMEAHLARLTSAGHRFGVPLDTGTVMTHLCRCVQEAGTDRLRVRLTVDSHGAIHAEAVPLPEPDARPLKLAWASRPVDSRSPFLYYKTTNRALYDAALAAHPGADDVLLFNENDEVTETCRANIAIEENGLMVTPPVACGLLAGTMREYLLAEGKLVQGVIRRQDVTPATRVYVFNSVRQWQEGLLS